MADYTEALRTTSSFSLGGDHYNPYPGHNSACYYGDSLQQVYPSVVEPAGHYQDRGAKSSEINRKLNQYRHSKEQNYWKNEYELPITPRIEYNHHRYHLGDHSFYAGSGYAVKMEPEVTNQEDSKGNLSMDEDSRSMDGRPLSERNGKHGKQDPKVCGVCGDKALGNNFNAITCESCKAFFRRNALRTKEFVCPFSDHCKVDPVTRRFCQKCRLKKCFDIGMRKEWIMTDEEKKIKKQKIEQNRLKRTSSESHPLLNGDVTAPKILAIGDDVPGKQAIYVQVVASPEGQSNCQQYQESVKQPMMPNKNNLINEYESSPETPEGYLQNLNPNPSQSVHTIVNGKHIRGGSNGVELPSPPIEHSRIPSVIHSPLSSHSSSSETPYERKLEGHHHPQHIPQSQHQQQTGHYTSESHVPQTHRAIWCENSENSNTNVIYSPVDTKPDVDPEYYPEKMPSSPLASSAHVHAIPRGATSPGSGSRSGGGAIVQNGGGQPSQMPLLASLMRPGGAESPPDNQLQESSASSFPESPEDDGSEIISMSTGRGVSHYQSSHSPESSVHSPPRLPTLTGGTHSVGGTQQYDDEDASSHSMNQSSSRDSTGEELAPLPLNTMDSILSVAISAEFNAFGVLGHSQNPHSKDLNKAEKAKLNELFFASQALNAPVDADGPIKIETADPSLINVINLTDVAIRRLIKMSKKICAFKNMCQEDQIALLKGGCTEMMILRSVVSYDPERDSWNIPHSNGYNIKLDVLKAARGNLYEEHQRFVKSFKAEWRSDDNIMIILCAITLFTPERPNVIHKDVVKLEQDSYYYLLKRYLESTRNGCEARSTYLQLIQKIAELHVLNSNHLRVFLEVNPREVEPLLIEIFDLKQ